MPGSAANEPGFERNKIARPAAARVLRVPQSLALSRLFCVAIAFIVASGCPLSGASVGGNEDGRQAALLVLPNGTFGDSRACNKANRMRQRRVQVNRGIEDW